MSESMSCLFEQGKKQQQSKQERQVCFFALHAETKISIEKKQEIKKSRWEILRTGHKKTGTL
jgi:hypothetical protein